MSIKPEYAHAIFRGDKRFEFRRSIFRQSVDIVVVYITNPIGVVYGEFEVRSIIRDTVSVLWDRTKAAAGIDKERFFAYFAGREYGYAIAVGETRRYKNPFHIQEHYGVRPPQSFLYLDQAQ
ncbi:MAG: ASCH domain-containing protein [Bryobacteraceae bacterium]